MNKEQLLALGLNEEQASKVLEGIKSFVPYSRFYDVNEAKKTAENNFAAIQKELETVKAERDQLDKASKQAKAEFAKQLNELKVTNAIDIALNKKNARDAIAVKAHLDMSQIKVDGDKVVGLDEQLDKLVADKATSFLFEAPNTTGSKDTNTQIKGTKGAENTASGGNTTNNVDNMSLSEVLATYITTPKGSM